MRCKGSRLVRTAFFDAPFLVATLNVIKNYALAGDAAHGAVFVHYTVRPHSAFHQPVAHLRSAASPLENHNSTTLSLLSLNTLFCRGISQVHKAHT